MARVGVVGATTLVGAEILDLLAAREFPLDELRLLGSSRSAGRHIEAAGRDERVELLDPNVFGDLDVVFFAAGPRIAGEFAEPAAGAGVAVIDLSSRFRLDAEVPIRSDVLDQLQRAAPQLTRRQDFRRHR